MPGGAGSCPVAAASGRGAGAITAEPSWVERPGRRDRARSDCPAGGRRSRGCPDAGQAGRCPVRLVRSRRGECPSTGRADVQRPRVRCPGVRCIQVSGRTGVRAAPGWAQRVDVPSWSAGGVVACRHRPGREGRGRRWPWLAGMRLTGAQGRRLAGVPAAAPPGRRPTAGAGPGQGASRVAREHGTEQVLPGPRRASWAGRRCDARPWAWTKRW